MFAEVNFDSLGQDPDCLTVCLQAGYKTPHLGDTHYDSACSTLVVLYDCDAARPTNRMRQMCVSSLSVRFTDETCLSKQSSRLL
jgi:hypothetical protein